jgi:hypothetical protein
MQETSRSYGELEPRILQALAQRQRLPGVNEPLTLIGITTLTLQDRLDVVSIGGKNIPIVIVVGTETGRIYQFALKALLPDL